MDYDKQTEVACEAGQKAQTYEETAKTPGPGLGFIGSRARQILYQRRMELRHQIDQIQSALNYLDKNPDFELKRSLAS